MKAGLMLAVNPNAKRQPEDFYATDPWAIYKSEDFLQSTLCKEVWEPACGQGHLADALKELGFKVRASDIIDRNYPNTEVIDFLSENNNKTWMVTFLLILHLNTYQNLLRNQYRF